MDKLKDILEGTRCWKGYEKKGTKKLFGKTVPNCVKRENAVPDHDGKAAPFGSGYNELEEDLRKWVKQKWVDISRKKKGGGHPACGASAGKKSRAGGKRAYPKCVKKSKAASMSKKDKESATRRKRKAYSGKGKPSKSPKMINTDPKNETFLKEINRLIEKNIPSDAAKWSYAKSQAKKKYKVYPSAYANAWLVKTYKKRGGGYRSA